MSILINIIAAVCGILSVIIIFVIIFYITEKNRSRIKYIEYKYPGRKKIANRNRSSEKALDSFKDIFIDKKKHYCYKIFITENKIYIVLYHHYIPQQSSPATPGLANIIEPIFNFIFKRQIEDLIRTLDRGSLEKSDIIEKLIQKSFHFYELNRSSVDIELSLLKLTLINHGKFIYGRKGKENDDKVIEQLCNDTVHFYYDSKYYDQYSNLVRIYSK